MNEIEARSKLDGAGEGSVLFVSYLAGRSPTDRAIREAERARRLGMARQHFVGTLKSTWRAKNGDFVFTVLCDNRDDERKGTQQGYRTFNPSLGNLLSVEVIQ